MAKQHTASMSIQNINFLNPLLLDGIVIHQSQYCRRMNACDSLLWASELLLVYKIDKPGIPEQAL
jgi:hypothetical protein